MKLRTKSTLFFVIFSLTVISTVVVYIEYIVGGTVRRQTADNFRIITEQSESAYFAFLEGLKARPIDWTSDTTVQKIAKEMLAVPQSSPKRIRLAEEFASYMREKKMPYDKTIFLVDLLDRNGIVIASTRADRIGTDERDEETRLHAHHFSNAIVSNFGEAFAKSLIFEEDESQEPMTHVVARIFAFDSRGTPEPLDAVLLVHLANTHELAHVLGLSDTHVDEEQETSRVTRMALLESYKTSDIYLVNSDHLMVTPSRYLQKAGSTQKMDTLPVRECFENGEEVSEEYDNPNGVRMFGASMCFKDDGLVLVVEIQRDEIFASLDALIRTAIAGGLAVLVFGVLVAVFFVRRPLSRINDVVAVAKRVSTGDLDAQVRVRTKDEIGYLASVFNTMITSIRDARKEMEASKHEIEEKADMLKKDVLLHKEQQKFLEESKRATLNLLEDSWKTGEKLQVESNRLQTVLASIGDALILIDGEYKVVLVNPRATQIFAMPLQEILGKDLREIMKLWRGKKTEVPPAKWPTEEMFLTNSIAVTTLEDDIYFATAQKERQIPVVLSVSPLGGGFSGGVIVIRDVTADHELDEAKSGFISVASHQLRTPLTSIRWYSEMLLSGDVGPLNDAQKDFMTEVHGGAERLYQTVDLLLGISRVESGKIKTEKQSIELSSFTGEIPKELASQVDAKGSTLSVLPPEGEPIVVSLDPLTLRQVVLNMFSNAIRYTNPKDGIIEIAWRKNETAEGQKSEVVYSVRDNGIGIPEADHGRVFSKFFRAENARAAVPDGSGLGLALVKELVESWGGKVWFETEEGKGTTFFFTVPLG